jgi:hypothetical protein
MYKAFKLLDNQHQQLLSMMALYLMVLFFTASVWPLPSQIVSSGQVLDEQQPCYICPETERDFGGNDIAGIDNINSWQDCGMYTRFKTLGMKRISS